MMINKKWIILPLYLLLSTLLVAQERVIQRLHKADDNFATVTKEIEENYKRLAQKKELLPLQFYIYKVQSGDTLFSIAARLNLNYDTIATLNQLASPVLLERDSSIMLPNLPAIYLYADNYDPLFIATKKRLSQENYPFFSTQYKALEEENAFTIEVYPSQKFSPQERLTFLTGFFLWPITGERIITSDYGKRLDPIAHKSYHQHNGIDLRLAMNSPVFASRMGQIKYVGYSDILGNHIIIDHEQGFQTIYGHLSKSIVQIGQKVRAGEQIAISGNSGLSTGPHLHFEIRKNGTPLDPKPFFVNN